MDHDQVQKLISELQNGTDRQRRAASYKLRNFKDEKVVQALTSAYTDTDSSVRLNAIESLQLIGTEEAREFLISNGQNEKLQPEDPKARELRIKIFSWFLLFSLLSFCGYLEYMYGMVPGDPGGTIPYQILLNISTLITLLFPVGALIVLSIAHNMYKNNQLSNANTLLYTLVAVYLINFLLLFYLLWLPH